MRESSSQNRSQTATPAWELQLAAMQAALHERGIYALRCAGESSAACHAQVAEALRDEPKGYYRGFCFYTAAAEVRAMKGQGLMLHYGDLLCDTTGTVQVGIGIVDVCSRVGLTTHWNGEPESPIMVYSHHLTKSTGGSHPAASQAGLLH